MTFRLVLTTLVAAMFPLATLACSEADRELHATWLSLGTTATCTDITARYEELHRQAWATSNHLPPNSSWAEINQRAAETYRERFMKAHGLPQDTTWAEVNELRAKYTSRQQFNN